jgi:hypothetical protein
MIQAWQASINNDYSSQRINSERSLQASFWSHLNNLLPHTRRLFIEPYIEICSSTGQKRVYPDLAVCNTKKVIAVLELKYTPRGRPKYEKDIRNLADIARHRRKIVVSNRRFRGLERDSQEYPLSKSILFVWAGVQAGENHSDQVYEYAKHHRILDDCYLGLHAETATVGTPIICHKP